MIHPIYLAGVVFMVVYSTTDALQTTDAGPDECYQCSGPTCPRGLLDAAQCPRERPFCATVAAAPEFKSTLTCSASKGKLCTLFYSPRESYHEFTCVCAGHLCNMPFPKEIQNKMISSTDFEKTNMTNLIEEYWKQSRLNNEHEPSLNKLVTVEMNATPRPNLKNTSNPVPFSSSPGSTMKVQVVSLTKKMPLAEALQQQMMAPSEDDEDDSEGSGLSEEHPSTAAPVDPAHPAGRANQPPDDSSAPQLLISFLTVAAPTLFNMII